MRTDPRKWEVGAWITQVELLNRPYWMDGSHPGYQEHKFEMRRFFEFAGICSHASPHAKWKVRIKAFPLIRGQWPDRTEWPHFLHPPHWRLATEEEKAAEVAARLLHKENTFVIGLFKALFDPEKEPAHTAKDRCEYCARGYCG